MQDTGEAGIADATVHLLQNGNVIQTTTTNGNGLYSFTGLMPGVGYQVQFITPAGYTQTSPVDIGSDALDSDGLLTGVVTLAPGENNPTLDSGFYNLASIGDKVFNDANANGIQDVGEAGVGGVTVKLFTCVNDQPGVQVGAATQTDGNGNYSFTGLQPGDYIVQFIAPDGSVLSTANVGANDLIDSDAGLNGYTGCYNLSSGENDTSVDAGIYRAGIDIEKYVCGEYQTGGNDGTEGLTPGFWKTHSEFGPAPLAGWPETGYSPTQSWEAVLGMAGNATVPGTPTLLDALGAGGGGVNALLRHSTAALLNAANPNVDYAYSVAQVISMTQSAITSGNYDATKNLFEAQNELGADLATPAGGSTTTVVTPDFDADTPGSGPQIPVGGKAVFTYVVKNTGTVEISNVVVTDNRLSGLTFTGGDTDNDGKLDTTETWTYRAEEIVTSSAEIANIGTVTGKGGAIDVTDSDAAHYNGSALAQSLGDFIWLDANRNGLQDAGEAGIGGLLVTLIGGGTDGLINGVGDTTATTTTDADGYYQFNNLESGVQYQVTFNKPVGTAYTTRDVGTNDTIDSDAGADGKSQVVTLSPGQNNPTLDAGVYVLRPGIDIEKTTNGPSNSNPVAPDYDNEDAPNGAGVPILTAGSSVTWTYKVTNTGETNFAKADIAIVDDNGSPTNSADDMSIANGKIVYQSGDDGDNILEAGEAWIYKATGTVQSLGDLGTAATLNFSGSSALDGTDGNTRTYTAGGVTVNANAWSRDKGTDTWQKAWLGAYGGGLGVTDSSEGTGSGDSHTVDNNGRDNYIVFQFSQNVVVDKAFLGYVVGDSDMSVYVGSSAAPITSMSNAVLAGMAKEFNDTSLTTTRWADFNAGNAQGNVLILAARDDGHSLDYFKVEQLVFQAVQSGGLYANQATVTAGGLSDSDMSHYTVQAPVLKARIGDRVWHDKDYDGIQDAGEAGIGGVTVKLLSATGTLLQTKTTDANGNYLFDVDAGTYKVQVVTPTGYVATRSNQGTDDALDSDTVSGVTGTYTVTAGQQQLTVDAGFYKKASIGDKVWYDSNCNGIQDAGEAGAAGVTVKLLNSTGGVQATTTTNASGNYSFTNLNPGNYSIQVVAPTGYAFSAKDQGTNDAADSDVDQWTGKTVATTLDSGENDLTWDAGLVSAARIGDKVWHDMDYDGIQDAGEAGIANVTVKLMNSTGTVLATKTTDANGNYFFDVAAGTYKVQVVTPSGYFVTRSNQGTNDSIDSDTVSGVTGTYTVTAGQQQLTVDGGLYKKASVGDKVWEDKNHNWLQDAGEPGIGGVKVTLKTLAGTAVATTTTDVNGNYLFSNLNPGDYYLVFDKTTTVYNGISMSNWMWGKKDIGTNDAIDSDVAGDGVSKTNVTQTSVFNLTSGESDMTWDASITPLVIDFNGDGIQTISRANAGGTFDLLGNGSPIASGWLSGEDGFLAVDRNGNGRIDDINELFGGFNKGDGYAKLGAFDSNGDGMVDAIDAAFGDLRVWKDANGNHQTDAGELLSLADAGIASLFLDYLVLPLLDGNGNLHLERGNATLADGSVVDMTDVYFNVSAADAAAAGLELPDLASLLSSGASLDGLLAGLGAEACAANGAAAPAVICDSSAAGAMQQMASLYDEAACV